MKKKILTDIGRKKDKKIYRFDRIVGRVESKAEIDKDSKEIERKRDISS